MITLARNAVYLPIVLGIVTVSGMPHSNSSHWLQPSKYTYIQSLENQWAGDTTIISIPVKLRPLHAWTWIACPLLILDDSSNAVIGGWMVAVILLCCVGKPLNHRGQERVQLHLGFTRLLCCLSSGAQSRTVNSPGEIWQCLEMCLVFTTGHKWVLASRG